LIPDAFNKEIFDFIKAHESSDAFEISLTSKHFSAKVRKLISNQVLSRQKLRTKVPEWLDFEQIILPDPVSVEQASSDITARYKSEMLKKGTLMDLTGGLGVDTYFFSKRTRKVVYIEKDPEIASIATYNFSLMGLENIEVICQSAQKIIKEWNSPLDYIYLDPSRRVGSRKVFKLEDSEPNLLEIQEDMLSKSDVVMAKISPMVDLKHALKQMKNIIEVHVLAVENDCKEILMLSGHSDEKVDARILTANFTQGKIQKFQSTYNAEQNIECEHGISGQFIYDPNAAIRKAGLFRSVCQDFSLKKPANNSHIYFGSSRIPDFPGRVFELIEVIPYHKFIKQRLFKKANIAIRNFPLSVAEIRRETNILEGGDIFIFGTTDRNKNVFFVICQKVSNNHMIHPDN
jgi:precorrin-6B methylase 2